MARKYANSNGIEDLMKVFDELQDPAARKKILRDAAKQALNPLADSLRAASPSQIKAGVQVKVSVKDTGKELKAKKKLKSKDYKEMTATVTFSSKPLPDNPRINYYGFAMILENGRKKTIGEIGRGTDWHAWGKPTMEVYRNIGATEPKRFAESTFFEGETEVEARFKAAMELGLQQLANKAQGKNK